MIYVARNIEDLFLDIEILDTKIFMSFLHTDPKIYKNVFMF